MRRRRHAGEVELRHLRNGVDDVVQLRAEALELLSRELQTRELRDVEELLAVEEALANAPARRGDLFEVPPA